jgi:hypothetical protein
MKTGIFIIAASLAFSHGALAQQSATAQGSASARSEASVSAGRDGAQVSQRGDASGATAVSGGSHSASGQFASGTELNATLERPVDARRARPGDEVRATLTEEARSDSGVVIEQGATLVGRVTTARPYRRASRSAGAGSESALAIVFDKAVLHDGREVPMHATVQALAAARSAASADVGDRGFGSADARGRASGAARGGAASGGVLGGAGATVGGAVGAGGSAAGGAASTAGRAAGGAARTGGRVAGSAAGSAGAAASGAGSATAAAGGSLGASGGAMGGLNTAGRFVAGTHGTFGLEGLQIASMAAGGAEASVISSASRNVRLDGGTRMLLVTGASASSR